jgi:DNA polymerase-3 subunit delta
MPGTSTAELLARLSKGKTVPAITLAGADSYLLELCRRSITDAYVPKAARSWALKRLSAREENLVDILGLAQTLPMMAPQQVIFVSDVEAWERQGDESRKEMEEALSGYLANPAPFTVLVFEAASLDQRTRLAKLLMEKTVSVSVDLPEEEGERARLAATLSREMARESGVELEREAAEELCDILNGEPAAIRSEIQKLAAYVGERKKITRADVDMLVISAKKYEVWDLADMLATQKPAEAFAFLDSLLREGEAAPALVGGLAWMYRKLMEAQELPRGLNGWQAASRLKMRPNAAELAIERARKFSRAQLASGLVALYEADNRLKLGNTNQRAVLEFLIARLASPNPA